MNNQDMLTDVFGAESLFLSNQPSDDSLLIKGRSDNSANQNDEEPQESSEISAAAPHAVSEAEQSSSVLDGHSAESTEGLSFEYSDLSLSELPVAETIEYSSDSEDTFDLTDYSDSDSAEPTAETAEPLCEEPDFGEQPSAAGLGLSIENEVEAETFASAETDESFEIASDELSYALPDTDLFPDAPDFESETESQCDVGSYADTEAVASGANEEIHEDETEVAADQVPYDQDRASETAELNQPEGSEPVSEMTDGEPQSERPVRLEAQAGEAGSQPGSEREQDSEREQEPEQDSEPTSSLETAGEEAEEPSADHGETIAQAQPVEGIDSNARVKRLIDATLNSMRTSGSEPAVTAKTSLTRLDKAGDLDKAPNTNETAAGEQKPKSSLTRLEKIREMAKLQEQEPAPSGVKSSLTRLEKLQELSSRLNETAESIGNEGAANPKSSLTRLDKIKEFSKSAHIPDNQSPKSSLTRLDKIKEFTESIYKDESVNPNSSLTRLEKVRELSKNLDKLEAQAESKTDGAAESNKAEKRSPRNIEPKSPGKIVLSLGGGKKNDRQRAKRDQSPPEQPETPAIVADPAVMRDHLKVRHRKYADKITPYVNRAKSWAKANKKIMFGAAALAVLAGAAMLAGRIYLADSKFKQGVALYDDKKYADALAVLKESVNLNPYRADSLGYLGRAYKSLKQVDLAEEAFEKALALKPNDTDNLTQLCFVLMKSKKFDQANKTYEKLFALKLDGKSYFDYANFAISNQMTGNFPAAVQNFSAALNMNPNDVFSFVSRADCLNKLKQYDRAVQDFTRALKLDPSNMNAYLGRGLSYERKGDYKRALDDFNTAVDKFPDQPETWLKRGDCYAAESNFQLALPDYNKALQIDPKSADTLFSRGQLYAKTGDYQNALADFKKISKVGGAETFQVLQARANAASYTGNYRQAIADATKALKLKPDDPNTLQIRGYCYGCTGQNKMAVADCDKGLAIRPKYVDLLILRGCNNAALGNTISAANDFESAIKINPNAVEAHSERATLYMNDGNYASAASEYRKAIKINPKDPQLRKQLALAQAELKKGAANAATVGVITQADRDAAKAKAKLLGSDFPTLVKDGCEALQVGNSGYAVAALMRAVRLKPNDVTARQYLANAFLAANHPLEAETQFKALETMGAKVPDADQRLAKAFGDSGMYARSVAMYQTLLAGSPSNHQYILAMAEALINGNKPSEALALCRHYLDDFVQTPADYDKFKGLYNKALAVQAQQQRARIDRARAREDHTHVNMEDFGG